MKTLITLIALFITSASLACGPIYYDFDGYVYLENGPITKTELSQFQLIAYEENGNTPPKFKPDFVYLTYKPVNAAEWKTVNIYHNYYFRSNGEDLSQTKLIQFMDSFTKTLSIGDSIKIWNYFIADTENPVINGERRYWNKHRKYTSIYVVEDEETVDFLRNSDRYIKTYPNPATTDFTLDITIAKDSKADYFIMDQFGRKVKEARLQSIQGQNSIFIDDLAQGQYIFYLTIDGQTYIRKFVKVDEGVSIK